MKQIPLFDYYVLGKAIEPLFYVKPEMLVNDAGYDAMAAYKQLMEVVREDSVFMPGTRAAAAALMVVLAEYFDGEGLEKGWALFFDPFSAAMLGAHKAEEIKRSVKEFDTIFKNESPRMTVFSSERKGLYDMEGLIDHADQHLPESVSKRLPTQAREDLRGAGRCLAFNIPTASVFHAWRALEVVIGAYYISMTGRTFAEAGVQRNWGDYIKALDNAGADKDITRNLDHIRANYRNPVMHPNVNVTADEAFSLLGIGFSAIAQVMKAAESQPYAAKALG